ncbi:MAG TPA: hypothetical protein ENI06_05690 [Spirochaetales bacterium]|nr:hypothetical protein [Spirochaetales bacterium]
MKKYQLYYFLLIFLLTSVIAGAEEFYIEEYDYFLDIPAGWQVYDVSDISRAAFANSSLTAVAQVISMAGESYQSADAMYEELRTEIGAEGDAAPFLFSGRDSVFSDLGFISNGNKMRGYFIFINGRQSDFILMAFSGISLYEEIHDFLLSVLDSFSPSSGEKYHPGPVSQFYYPFPGRDEQQRVVIINNRRGSIPYDQKEIAAAQVLIEREARILASYKEKEKRVGAWQRYYRMIYRDNYHRLDKLYLFLENIFRTGVADLPRDLLAWVQGFSYSRTGTLADLQSPLSSALTRTGDCDSRALLYTMLLHHFKIDALLLVSSRYSHSLAGVNVPGQGARIHFDDNSYLIAETTDQVDLGLIDRDMADPSGWIPVPLGDF